MNPVDEFVYKFEKLFPDSVLVVDDKSDEVTLFNASSNSSFRILYTVSFPALIFPVIAILMCIFQYLLISNLIYFIVLLLPTSV